MLDPHQTNRGCYCKSSTGHPIDVLAEEHRVILAVLAAMELELGLLERGASVRLGFWVRTFDFLEHFADRCHHGKEEDLLFPALEAAGMPQDHGPTSVMRAEHEEARLCRARMTEALQSRDVRWLCVAVGSYVDLLRRHIRKEDEHLLPLARQLLGQAAEQALRCAFHGFETEDLGAGSRQRYLELGAELCAEAQSHGA